MLYSADASKALKTLRPEHLHNMGGALHGDSTSNGDRQKNIGDAGDDVGSDGACHVVGEPHASRQGSPSLRLRRHRAVATHDGGDGAAVTK